MAVKVFLIRHGEADGEVPDALDDDARSLTPKARAALPGHFKALAGYFGQPDAIFTSPLMRTVQTATLLAQALSYEGPLRAHRCLLPDGPVGAIEAMLSEFSGQTVLLVGHQPVMGAAAMHFLSKFTRAVSPGTVIGIERPDDQPTAGRLVCYSQVGQGVLEAL